jgi:hypothetical protein
MDIVIKNESLRLVTGEVYVPFRLDAENEFMRPEEIQKAAFAFMELSRTGNVDEEHNLSGSSDVVVESYIARDNDPHGFIPGSWIATGRVTDDERWEKVLRGELNGWSMYGKGVKIPCRVEVSALVKYEGTTEENLSGDSHTHDLVLTFDELGRVVPAQTTVKNDHFHLVSRTTATEMEHDHAHRFHITWDEHSDHVMKTTRMIDAKEMVDVHPQWLSLVGHAASRRGFKFVRKTEEVRKMDRVVHAIITRKGVTMEELSEYPGLEWAGSAQIRVLETKDLGKKEKFVLIPAGDFETGSLQTLPTPAEGVRMLVGILKAENPSAVVVSTGGQEAETTSRDNEKLDKQEDTMDEAKILELIDKRLAEKTTEVMKGQFDDFKKDLISYIDSLEEKDADNAGADGEMEKTDQDVLATKEDLSGFKKEILAALAEKTEADRKTIEDLTQKVEGVVEKTEKAANAGTSFPGAKDVDEEVVEKKDPAADSFWAGRLFRAGRSPQVTKILGE